MQSLRNPLFILLIATATAATAAGTVRQAPKTETLAGPAVLESWGPGALDRWRADGGSNTNPVLTASIMPSPSGIGEALRTIAAPGNGECRPVSVTRSFDAAKVQAYDAYLDAFVVIRSSDEDAQPVFLRVELFDEAGAKIGQRDYYGGGLIPRSLRNSGKATELPIAAGVVRIPLHHVTYRYVTFSRLTVSIVHQGCGGTSEVTVGGLVFCPNAKSCGLTVKEAPADGAAEVQRLLGTLDDNPIGSYLRGIVPAPRIAPAARPSAPPVPKPMVQRVSWTTAQPAGQCDASIEEYIEDARRINAVIGERPDLKGRLADLATSMLGALKLPEGSGAAIAKDITERVVDHYDMLTALGEQVGNEEFEQASATITTLVLKNLLAQVDGPAHFGKLSKTGHTWLQAYLRGIPDHRRDMVIDNLRIVLKDQPKYVEALSTGMSLDLGTVAGGLSEGQVRDAMQTLVLNLATTLSPQFALVKSSLLAMNESALAAQTYVADGEVTAMYAAWKEDPKGDYDLDPKYRFTNQALLATKRVMRPLGFGVDPRTGAERNITDAEADKFLLKQFETWQKAEAAAANHTEALSRAWEAYGKSDQFCVGTALDKQVWPEGRTTGRTWKRLWDGCYEAIERFKKYAALHVQVDREFRGWHRSGTECSSGGMMDLGVQQLACTYIQDGANAYYDALGERIDRCGWLSRPLERIKADRQKGVARELQSLTPLKLQAVLQNIGSEKSLACLCRQMNRNYEPLGKGCDPDVSKGLCLLDAFGCSRDAPPMDTYRLSVCGVDKAVTAHLFRVRLAQGRGK